ncbi:MAG: hypothetical protein LBE57_01250 [Methanosarcinales archaeon]|jgi:TM2 domain-containing membrane protein YozV|nr:hypothetical protein [Methanosarcinales archaeon]
MANNFCSACGKKSDEPDANYCAGCGSSFHSSQTESTSHENVVYVKQKSVFVSIILSIFIPGSGQVYNGNLKKGLVLCIGFYLGLLALVIPGIIVWIYALYNAYKETGNINKGLLPFIEPTPTDAVIIYIADFVMLTFAYIAFYILAIFMFAFMRGFMSAFMAV